MSILTRSAPASERDLSHGPPASTEAGTGRGGRLARWSSAGNVLAGAWLLVSPLVLDFGTPRTDVVWNSAVCGVLVLLVALAKAVRPQLVGVSWLNVGLGGWLVLSPWVIGESGGFVEHSTGNVNMVLVGMVVMALAITSSTGTFLGDNLSKRRR